MVVQFQTSFIPKKAPVIAPPTRGAGGRGINLFAIIALIIFSLTVGLSAAVFFYQRHLVSAIIDMDRALAAAKKKFEPEFVDVASRLGARIAGAQELLNSHKALSPLFDVLEKKTLETVRFRDFMFTATEKKMTFAMTGQAKSFNAVALQSDVFGAEHSFKDPVFSNFTLNEDGDVLFNFRAEVEPTFLLYRETVIASGPADEGGASKAQVEP